MITNEIIHQVLSLSIIFYPRILISFTFSNNQVVKFSSFEKYKMTCDKKMNTWKGNRTWGNIGGYGEIHLWWISNALIYQIFIYDNTFSSSGIDIILWSHNFTTIILLHANFFGLVELQSCTGIRSIFFSWIQIFSTFYCQSFHGNDAWISAKMQQYLDICTFLAKVLIQTGCWWLIGNMSQTFPIKCFTIFSRQHKMLSVDWKHI